MLKNTKIHVVHPIPPLYDTQSTILILGSFPSVKSRESMFFYGHPQNRFWKVLANLFHEPVPQSIPEKKELAIKHHIALWDTIASCDIVGSSDASIENAVPNNIESILKCSHIERIYTNGKKSHDCYQKFIYPKLKIHDIVLPSTSPANAAWSLERLIEKWKIIL